MSGPYVEKRGERHYAGIPIRAALAEWDRVNALVPELYGWLDGRGIVPSGGPIYRYRTISDDIDLDVGVSVDEPVGGDHRVRPGLLPAGRYAVLIHEGRPDRQERSHAVLQAWAAEQGLKLARDGNVWTGRYESYLTNPGEEPDQTKWNTEIGYLIED